MNSRLIQHIGAKLGQGEVERMKYECNGSVTSVAVSLIVQLFGQKSAQNVRNTCL